MSSVCFFIMNTKNIVYYVAISIKDHFFPPNNTEKHFYTHFSCNGVDLIKMNEMYFILPETCLISTTGSVGVASSSASSFGS